MRDCGILKQREHFPRTDHETGEKQMPGRSHAPESHQGLRTSTFRCKFCRSTKYQVPSSKGCIQVLFTVSSAELQPSDVLTKEETPRTRRTARCTNILPLVCTKGTHRSLKNHFCCNAEKPSFEQLTQKDFEYQMSAVSHQFLIDEGIAGDGQSVREERNYAQ